MTVDTVSSSMLLASLALIGYTYVGYPLALWLLTRLVTSHDVAHTAPKTAVNMSERAKLKLPSVTLLIAAYNEEAVLRAKLLNSLELDYPKDKLQILVVADGSDDRTVAIAQSFAARGIELSYVPSRDGKMAAINRAMAQVCSTIVVFSDANNLYAKETIRALVAPFADERVGAVAGAKIITRGDGALGDNEGLYWQYESFIKRCESRLGNCVGVAGEVLAVRRVLFRPLPDTVINDDAYLAMDLLRRGYQIQYAPAARSYERISLAAADEVVRRTRINAGRYQALADARKLLPWQRPLVFWQIVSHKFLRLFLPFAMISALASNLLLVLLTGPAVELWAFLLLGAQILFYSIAVVGNIVTPSGRIGKIFYLPTFLVNSNWAALLGCLRYLRGQQTTRWQRVRRRNIQLN